MDKDYLRHHDQSYSTRNSERFFDPKPLAKAMHISFSRSPRDEEKRRKVVWQISLPVLL